MSGDPFPLSVRNRLYQKYADRCVICLVHLSELTAQCAHVFDRVADQEFGLLPVDFQSNSEGNGYLLCPTCHFSYFTLNYIALSPSLSVLRYISNYLTNTQVADQLPLHEVFQLLRDATTGTQVNLPDPSPILPYLDLYTLVVLNPVPRMAIITHCLPPLSIFKNGQFRPATTRAARKSPNVARIFDPIAFAANGYPVSMGIIPLSAKHPEFSQQRYWRLPINTEIILARLIERSTILAVECEEINLIETIHAQLLQRAIALRGPSSRGHRRGRGENPDTKARTEKRQALDGEFILKFLLGERVEQASHQSLSSSRAKPHHGVHPEEWDVASTFSTLSDDKRQPARSHLGGSEPSTRISYHDEDNPRRWKYGPSFSSDKIVATARRIMKI